MMGMGAPGEIADMLSMCSPAQEPIYFAMKDYVVVVTGFGPFASFSENPSSVIIDELEKQRIPGVQLQLQKLDVAYDEVKEKIPNLWDNHNPDLVIHIGAHDVQNIIKFEQQAFPDGYCKADVKGCEPGEEQTGCDLKTVLISKIDCDDLAKKVNETLGFDGEAFGGLKTQKSEDPGRYLCGFSYFLSLSKDPSKALFIHVPPFTDACTKETVSEAIRQAIKSILSIN